MPGVKKTLKTAQIFYSLFKPGIIIYASPLYYDHSDGIVSN